MQFVFKQLFVVNGGGLALHRGLEIDVNSVCSVHTTDELKTIIQREMLAESDREFY